MENPVRDTVVEESVVKGVWEEVLSRDTDGSDTRMGTSDRPQVLGRAEGPDRALGTVASAVLRVNSEPRACRVGSYR